MFRPWASLPPEIRNRRSVPPREHPRGLTFHNRRIHPKNEVLPSLNWCKTKMWLRIAEILGIAVPGRVLRIYSWKRGPWAMQPSNCESMSTCFHTAQATNVTFSKLQLDARSAGQIRPDAKQNRPTRSRSKISQKSAHCLRNWHAAIQLFW